MHVVFAPRRRPQGQLRTEESCCRRAHLTSGDMDEAKPENGAEGTGDQKTLIMTTVAHLTEKGNGRPSQTLKSPWLWRTVTAVATCDLSSSHLYLTATYTLLPMRPPGLGLGECL